MQEKPTYWDKSKKLMKTASELSWNFPEQKQGSLAILGGNSSSFSKEIKIAEYTSRTFPFLKSIKNIFPDSLKKQIPILENIDFFESTESGSFKRSGEFYSSIENADFALYLGDFSKNSETALAISEIIKRNEEVPTLLTRDTVDLVANEADNFIDRENLTILASLVQLQNLFRTLYYPKVILLSQPLLPILETLHKFTISYPCTLITFHEGKIICANSGKIATVDLEQTDYSPLSLWSGELATNISVFTMFNKNKPFESAFAGTLYK